MTARDAIGRAVRVVVDRPLGSRHPAHPDMVYSVNYGWVEGVTGGDGEGQDAYILGVDAPIERFEGAVIAVIHRRDDVEDKWVVAPPGMAFAPDAIRAATWFTERYFDSEIVI